VLDVSTLEFADGTRIELDLAVPCPEQMAEIEGVLYPAGKEAADFLRKLVGDKTVSCLQAGGPWIGFAGEASIERAMIANFGPWHTFQPGQTSKTVTVSVRGDRTPEADETFFLNLANSQGATILDDQGLGTIQNDDGGSSSAWAALINDLAMSQTGRRRR
jgi:hypothetical protein